MPRHIDLTEFLRRERDIAISSAQQQGSVAFLGHVTTRWNQAAESTAQLIEELQSAHLIIRCALNHLEGDARQRFIQQVQAARLDGEGVTRANERERLLARVRGGEA